MLSQRRVAQAGLAAAALVLFTSVGILVTQSNEGSVTGKSGGVAAGQTDAVPMAVSLSARARSNDSAQP